MATLFAGDPRALELSVALSTACWAAGRDLTDWAVLADVVRRSGLDDDDLTARASAPAVKRALQERTAAAIAAGVFGVPTFVLEGELFWGTTGSTISPLASRVVCGICRRAPPFSRRGPAVPTVRTRRSCRS